MVFAASGVSTQHLEHNQATHSVFRQRRGRLDAIINSQVPKVHQSAAVAPARKNKQGALDDRFPFELQFSVILMGERLKIEQSTCLSSECGSRITHFGKTLSLSQKPISRRLNVLDSIENVTSQSLICIDFDSITRRGTFWKQQQQQQLSRPKYCSCRGMTSGITL